AGGPDGEEARGGVGVGSEELAVAASESQHRSSTDGVGDGEEARGGVVVGSGMGGSIGERVHGGIGVTPQYRRRRGRRGEGARKPASAMRRWRRWRRGRQ